MENYYLSQNGETLGPYSRENLSRMHDQGTLADTDLVCAHGTESWVPAHSVLSAPAEIEYDQEPARRQKRRTSNCLNYLFGLFGIGNIIAAFFAFAAGSTFLSTIWGIAGLVCIALTSFVGRTSWFCGACGNEVAQTSMLCPTCGSELL